VKSTRDRRDYVDVIAAPPARSSPAALISDQARIDSILARLPAEDRALLEPRLLPAWRLRRRRLDERDAEIRALAANYPDSTGWRVARRLHREFARYVGRGSWRFDCGRGPPADPRGARLYRVVRLSGNKARPVHSEVSATTPNAGGTVTCMGVSRSAAGPVPPTLVATRFAFASRNCA